VEYQVKVLTDLSLLYSKAYEAKLIAQENGLTDKVAELSGKMAELSTVTENIRSALSKEWQEDAMKLHSQFTNIISSITESLNDMAEHMDVANNVASVLDFIEEVIILAAKIAP
jgi:hypothetical protein